MADLDAIYVKTPAGVEEIRTRARHLPHRQRTLLIMLDGARELAAFTVPTACSLAELREAAVALIGQGLIALADGKSERQAEAPSRAATRHTLIRLAEKIFGAKAGPVKQKLEKAAGDAPEQLLEAAVVAAKLAKLTIDDQKAQIFLAEARKQIGG